MKRLILFLIFPLLVTGCEYLDDEEDYSDDYEPSGPILDYNPQYKVISIKSKCSSGNVKVYCVSDGVYASVATQVGGSSDPCTSITFADADGVSRTGIYASMGNNNSNGCLRGEQ